MPPILTLLRPKQWIKNGFVCAPLFFSLQFLHSSAWIHALLATAAFTLTSCIVYVVNDIADRKQDRMHPKKQHRPIASGAISVRGACLIILVLAAILALILPLLPREASYFIAAYFTLNMLYSFGLKQIAIIDVLIIASGFVLRVLVGGAVIDVPLSSWIILATFLLTLFLGFGKRRHELSVDGYKTARKSLSGYSEPLLDSYINMSCASAFLTYAIYCVETAEKLAKPELVYTVAFVAFGLFRYLRALYIDKEGGSPEHILYKDALFTGNILAWLITMMWVLMG